MASEVVKCSCLAKASVRVWRARQARRAEVDRATRFELARRCATAGTLRVGACRLTRAPTFVVARRFARAEGVGLPERKARAPKGPQGAERQTPSGRLTSVAERRGAQGAALVAPLCQPSEFMKRPFHLPKNPNMRISQCFLGFGLHSRLETGDIPGHIMQQVQAINFSTTLPDFQGRMRMSFRAPSPS